MMIAKEPEKYGFGVIQPENPLAYDTVGIPNATTIHAIAEACDTDLSVLLGLNPELRQGCTPPSYQGYRLKVPSGSGKDYSLLNDLPAIDTGRLTASVHKHKVRRGESLRAIAKRYGVSPGSIMEMNNLKTTKQIRGRQYVFIPIIPKNRDKKGNGPQYHYIYKRPKEVVSTTASIPRGNTKVQVQYEVKAGDTVWKISKRYGVGLSSIQQWNKDIDLRDLSPGQTLVLWVRKNTRIVEAAHTQEDSLGVQPQEILYTIKARDTLSGIARRFQVTVANILAWNNMTIHKRLKPGDRLRLFPSVRINAHRGDLPPRAVED
jgi:membrane-bound lytic murein transglycosylase D